MAASVDEDDAPVAEIDLGRAPTRKNDGVVQNRRGDPVDAVTDQADRVVARNDVDPARANRPYEPGRVVAVVVAQHHVRRESARELPGLLDHPCGSLRRREALHEHDAGSPRDDAPIAEGGAVPERIRYECPDAGRYLEEPPPGSGGGDRELLLREPRGPEERGRRERHEADVRSAGPRPSEEIAPTARVPLVCVLPRILHDSASAGTSP